MSKKRQKYPAELKARVVLDLLSGDHTLGKICSKYGVTNKSVQAWKQQFLENATLAFTADHASAEQAQALVEKQKEVDDLHRQLGKRTAELEWAAKKLKCLDYDTRSGLLKSEHEPNKLSIQRCCELLGYQRSGYYYCPKRPKLDKMPLLRAIDRIYSETPFYGYRKVHQSLIEEGFIIGANRVNVHMRELGLKAIAPAKKLNTTVPVAEHKKYPYLLKSLDINCANQVWSTDITYIRVAGGFVYMAAVIDWYSKAILSWKISNTMDTALVMDALNDALEQYGQPEIFNTDQGSQYTSHEYTKRLSELGIQISMDGKGRATDNIAIERFWRSAKYENIYLHEYQNMRQLKQGMVEYMEFYNNRRFHQALNYQKPMRVYWDSLKGDIMKAA